MTPAPTLEDYEKAPIGRYFVGKTWLHFWPQEDLVGFVLWGRPSESDVQLLTRMFVLEFQRPFPGRVSIADGRRLESIDLAAFNYLDEFVGKYKPQIAGSLSKQAILRSKGLVGAVQSGFYGLRSDLHEVKVFDDTREAYNWLGVGSMRLFDELDAIFATVTGQSPLLVQLRAALSEHLRDASLGSMATLLGIAERTLQRRLNDTGTSFANELTNTRIAAAQALLRDSDQKLETIAAEVGCASAQHLATLFRRHVGESPSEWRAHNAPGT